MAVTTMACLPVLVQATGTALADMLRADAAVDAAGSGAVEPTTRRPSARSRQDQAGSSPDQALI
jgi:hypothetical protein